MTAAELHDVSVVQEEDDSCTSGTEIRKQTKREDSAELEIRTKRPRVRTRLSKESGKVSTGDATNRLNVRLMVLEHYFDLLTFVG